MAGTVTVCPECDCPQFNRRVTKEPEFRCGKCGSEFDDPDEREDQRGGTDTCIQVTADMVIEDLHRVADEIGRSPTCQLYLKHGRYSTWTAANRFGSWNAALDAAGLSRNPDVTDTADRGRFGLADMDPEDVGLSPIGEVPGQ